MWVQCKHCGTEINTDHRPIVYRNYYVDIYKCPLCNNDIDVYKHSLVENFYRPRKNFSGFDDI